MPSYGQRFQIVHRKLRETVHGDFVPFDGVLSLLYGLVKQLEIPEE